MPNPAEHHSRTVCAVVARIRREANETFDMALDTELRALADLIEREFLGVVAPRDKEQG